MGMASAAEGCRDAADVGAVFTRAHAEIAAAVAIVPNQAEGMFGREPFADLARQHGALDGRSQLTFESKQAGV